MASSVPDLRSKLVMMTELVNEWKRPTNNHFSRNKGLSEEYLKETGWVLA